MYMYMHLYLYLPYSPSTEYSNCHTALDTERFTCHTATDTEYVSRTKTMAIVSTTGDAEALPPVRCEIGLLICRPGYTASAKASG